MKLLIIEHVYSEVFFCFRYSGGVGMTRYAPPFGSPSSVFSENDTLHLAYYAFLLNMVSIIKKIYKVMSVRARGTKTKTGMKRENSKIRFLVNLGPL